MRAIWWGSQTHSTIYTLLYHISWQWVACLEQASRRARASEEKWQSCRKDSALGCFFSRTVNSCVGKLLIKCGVHVCLKWERIRIQHIASVSSRSSSVNVLASLPFIAGVIPFVLTHSLCMWQCFCFLLNVIPELLNKIHYTPWPSFLTSLGTSLATYKKVN